MLFHCCLFFLLAHCAYVGIVAPGVNGGFSDAERRHFWNRLDGDRGGSKAASLKNQCVIYDKALQKSNYQAFPS